MQQYLPLAVLKPKYTPVINSEIFAVATVLTACGIETIFAFMAKDIIISSVATVLTACGIETGYKKLEAKSGSLFELQQYLPLAVLKLSKKFNI